MISYLKASLLSTLALAVVQEWKVGTDLGVLLKDRSGIVLFADEADQ